MLVQFRMEIADNDRSALAPVYTGTMAWAYDDWRGVFYEANVHETKMLEQYASVMPALELDNTAYGAPRASTIAQWNRSTPPNFRFATKVPQAITHERRLAGSASDLAIDFGTLFAEGLGSKLGAILVQLPPDFTADHWGVLIGFADALASRRSRVSHLPWGFELRNGTWLETEIASFLAERGFFCVTSDQVDFGVPLRYVRLLGKYGSVGRFDERQIDRSAEIAEWAKRIDQARRAAHDPIYVFIRNYFEGYAPGSIDLLREQLSLPVITPPGRLQMSLF